MKLKLAVFREINDVCIVSARFRNGQYGAVFAQYKGKSAVSALE